MATLSRPMRPRPAHHFPLALCLYGLAVLTLPAAAQAPFLKLGVYGGVPHPNVHRGKLVAARLTQIDPPQGGPLQITLPLNGLLDYSFYYTPTSTTGTDTFLPAGEYSVVYLDTSGNSVPAGVVFYKPNSGFTNGVQVPHNPPNSGPWASIPVTPLGIQGTVTISVGPGGTRRPAKGVSVQLFSADASQLIESVSTNGNGFYTFYYTSGGNASFLPPGDYLVRVTLFSIPQDQKVTYQPNTDPTSIGYYVLGAHAVANFDFAQP